MSVLNEELDRILSVIKIVSEQEDSNEQMNVNLRKPVEVLKYLRLYSKNIEKMLIEITNMATSQIIDFHLLERGLKTVLLKKGDKKKNVEEYFNRIISSLKLRDKTGYGPDSDDDYGFEVEEPSIVPKKVYRKEIFELQVELLKMQEWLKESNKTVIIVFEGRDSAGKGSTIKKFTENLNPRYYNIIALGVPTPEDRKDWWNRYKKEIKPGMINLFDRSWYNRGLVEPVMGYGSPEEYEDFMENVEEFEMDLVREGDYLFKLWFSIDKGTQKRRFDIRQQSPLKYWKYSPNDSKMQDLWDRFTEFKEKLFDKTSTVNHPWVIVDAEDKRVSGLNAIRYILQNIPYKGKDEKVLDKSYPEALAVLRPKS
jgi:polyphosphate kinase 2